MKTITSTSILLAFLLLFSTSSLRAQDGNAMHHKDYIGENPTADADIKVVSDYTNAVVSGDLVKAKSLLAASYMGYGPGPVDSANVNKEMQSWETNYTTQTNRKVEFITQTFRVLNGDLQGNWVSVWGTYYFTTDGKDIKLPYQSTMHVTNGKIDRSIIYFDLLSVFQKLGYTLTPPAGNK
ncbi:MAG TPA: hypothetical protein PKM63_21580 [Panacibacter sp.]|nr:hypothetical protein [Panacibacter sp.]HNP46904.1 hypothetical protein [Panacibacter sp.]